MITVARSVVINRPIAEVFGFVANFENEPRWMPGIMESRQTSVGPIGVGTTFREVVQNLGPRMENTFAVTQYVPARTFAIESTLGRYHSRSPIALNRSQRARDSLGPAR